MRVLCVSPRFPPSNAPDCHRVRLLLPHLLQQGCAVEVLAVEPDDVPCPVDPWLADRLPAEIPVHRVNAWRLSGWGLNGLAQRSLVPLWRKGSELLSARSFDLVFFSTTEFLLHLLGPVWQRRHGVPFCMDFQDPWVNDYYRDNPEVVPPGGRLKHGMVSVAHRAAERVVVPRCSGFLSVSSDYLSALERRYGAGAGWQPRLLATFPGEPSEVQADPAPAGPAGSVSGMCWRYVGCGGPAMERSAVAFFGAWRKALDSGVMGPDHARFEAIGTSYANDSQALTFLPAARRAGLEGLVAESSGRIPYSEALAALRSSDALIAFGSDDPAYTASKTYPYLLAGRPVLAIFHERSSAVEVLRTCGGGVCVTFGETTGGAELVQSIYDQWFASGAYRRAVALDMTAFSRYTAAVQAADVADWFRSVVSSGRRASTRGLGA